MGKIKAAVSVAKEALAKYMAEDAAKLAALRAPSREPFKEVAATAVKKEALAPTKEALRDTPGAFRKPDQSPASSRLRKFSEDATEPLDGAPGFKRGGRITGYRGYGKARKS